MSAADDDTELRDLLIQNLENSGVLNKLKAEMRAAVFLAMEEQDKVENKTPLINENLKKCLNTRDGRLVASLIVDFLQIFNLDFTLAVFQPEINLLNSLDSRALVCRDLGLSESQVNRNCPLLLELVRRGQQPEKLTVCLEEPSQEQLTNAQRRFDFYDKDQSGLVLKDDLKSIFMDLFPNMNKNMLEMFITDELKATDRAFCKKTDVKLFLEMYKHLFTQCRSVVVQDSEVSRVPEGRTSSPPVSKIPRYKNQKQRGQSELAAKDSDGGTSPGPGYIPQQPPPSLGLEKEHLDLDLEVEDDLDDGDSFFDDPLPKPQKTYGCVVPLSEDSLCGPVVAPMRRGKSLNDLSVLVADSEGQRDDHSQSSVLRKPEGSGGEASPAVSLSEFPRPEGGGRGAAGGGAAGGGAAGGSRSSLSEQSHSRNGGSNCREKGLRDSKAPNDKSGSLHLDEDVEYDDDFNSHRSDFSKSELSIGEEIEEVSIEGPDSSDKFDETTQDLSVSQFSLSHGADYMENVS